MFYLFLMRFILQISFAQFFRLASDRMILSSIKSYRIDASPRLASSRRSSDHPLGPRRLRAASGYSCCHGTLSCREMLLRGMDMSSIQSVGEVDGKLALEKCVQLFPEAAVGRNSEFQVECIEGCKLIQSKNEDGDVCVKVGKVGRLSGKRGLCTKQILETGVMSVIPQHARPVRFNRGIKRRFPGDESDDNMIRKRARVRSMMDVCALYATASTQLSQGKIQICQAKRKCRLLKCSGGAKKQHFSRKLLSETSKHGKSRCEEANSAEVLKHQYISGTFRCNEEGCDKVFADASALYRHARVHGDRPFVCHYDGCSKRFLERSKLKRHFLIHTGEKSFLCLYEGCGKAFSLDFNLRSHMKTHTGEYHECPHQGCKKKYCQNYKLRAHINKEHREGLPIKNKSAPFGVISGNVTLNLTTQKLEKKQENLMLKDVKLDKLEKWKDGRGKRIKELASERNEEAKKLAKFRKSLERMNGERERVDLYDSEILSSVESDFGQLSGEEKEVLVFAQKLPTRDQGARLVQAVKVQFSSQTEPSVAHASAQLEGIDVTVGNSLANTSGLDAVTPGVVLASSKPYMSPQCSFIGNKLMQSHVPAVDPCEDWMQTRAGEKQEQKLALNSSCTHVKSTSILSSKFINNSDLEQHCEERSYCNIQPSICDADIDRITQQQKYMSSQQSEPPVVYLFSFQEQPCLVD